ncbi:MAG: sodium:calcium antiporter [Candidatus Pacearchaeota archaeon]|jgi:cation:H+ antiporter
MIIINVAIFLVFFLILIKSANKSVSYASGIAKVMYFQEFAISFFIVSFISVLPEASVSIMSAFNGTPELGLGTLFGSNVADLTIIFGIVTLFSLKGIAVKSKILKNEYLYLILLFLPILLGLDGFYSRIDGLVLIIASVIFFIKIFKDGKMHHRKYKKNKDNKLFVKILLLTIFIILLVISSYYTVEYADKISKDLNISISFLGLTLISLGTCLPELFFSLNAVKKKHDDLALGDILGTVLTDVTLIVGIMAIIKPFSFNLNLIHFTAFSMFIAGLLVILFTKTDKMLTKKEGILLILFYIIFLLLEFFITN